MPSFGGFSNLPSFLRVAAALTIPSVPFLLELLRFQIKYSPAITSQPHRPALVLKHPGVELFKGQSAGYLCSYFELLLSGDACFGHPNLKSVLLEWEKLKIKKKKTKRELNNILLWGKGFFFCVCV